MSATDRRDNLDSGDLEETIGAMVDKKIRNAELALRVSAPGTVVAYDPATQRAQVTVGFLQIQDQDTPAGSVEIPLPPDVVFGARVAWRQSATSYDVGPIAPGDTGLIVFADRCLDQWYLQAGVPVDPIDGRAHDMADGVFFPGLAADAGLPVPPLNPLARTIEAPVIQLGAAAADFALQGTALIAAANGISTALAAVPNATDPATVITLANANKAAIIGLIAAIAANVSTKVMVE